MSLNYDSGTGILKANKLQNESGGAPFIQGVVDGSTAIAGQVGEVLSAQPVSPVTPSGSGLNKTIVSLVLTAGDWDVFGTVIVTNETTMSGRTYFLTGISLTDNAFDLTTDAFALTYKEFGSVAVGNSSIPAMRRINISGSTTIYLVGQMNYSVAGSVAWATSSKILAKRVR